MYIMYMCIIPISKELYGLWNIHSSKWQFLLHMAFYIGIEIGKVLTEKHFFL